MYIRVHNYVVPLSWERSIQHFYNTFAYLYLFYKSSLNQRFTWCSIKCYEMGCMVCLITWCEVCFCCHFVLYWKMCWILSITLHIIGTPMCLPFQRHLIHYHLVFLSEDMACMALLIWVGHKSNVPKWNIFRAHNSS